MIEKQGKIKSIGSIEIDYYKSYDGFEKTGKVKAIGSIEIDYYKGYDGQEKAGKIKSIKGNTQYIYATT